MSAPLRRVLVRRPTVKPTASLVTALGPPRAAPDAPERERSEPSALDRSDALAAAYAAADWRQPDPTALAAEHAAFVALLERLGVEVDVAPALDGLVDACYARDAALVTGRGAVLLRMAKPVRRAEPAALGEAFAASGVPVIGVLESPALADGGDLVWLDQDTLLVGRSYRTNAAAVDQLRDILAAEGVRVTSVDLPHDRGPEHVLHLMSVLSPVADDLAVVYPPLAPVPLMEELALRGITVLPVDPAEYPTLGCNVLAVRPRVVVLAAGNPRTAAALRAHGCEVHEYAGGEISVKGDGGPTCLTQPLWRAG